MKIKLIKTHSIKIDTKIKLTEFIMILQNYLGDQCVDFEKFIQNSMNLNMGFL